MTDTTTTASPLLARLATLERENTELRLDRDRWRRKAAGKENALRRYQNREDS
ncbi:hypothetical protein [Rathayibacter festucae]|uniref:hypothetical protein n=1 Tax=Rathayibacter festucae TaxID=110937 RepID=UPI0013E3935A|nr:hypothetical protein [Rathayibacter festucae]